MEAELCAQAIIAASKVVQATGVDEMIKDLVKTHLGNRVEEFFGKQKDRKELELIENKFSEYMIRSYKNYIYINTIVFRNQQKTIDDLYIPLTVSECKTFGFLDVENHSEILINGYKEDLLPRYKKVLLVDQAGMGKSTISKYLYLSTINENKGIPILIELRKLSHEKDIIDFIMNEINGLSEHFDKDGVLKLIERGDFIFFFDGYDEINKDNKIEITENIQAFISKAGNNTFLMTSREENELNSFGDFQRFDIRPLEKSEAYALIKKLDNNGELSSELIEKLENDKNLEIIKEFLENPLMVSLLYKAFEYKNTIPYKKHIFYRQVYDALFEEHDMTKKGAYVRKKKSGLDIEDFHRVLRTIAFFTLSKGISYSKEDFIKIIYNSKKKIMGVEFNENDLIYDLTHNVPIFVKDGVEYRWSHKSFQEYFAASYICLDSDEKNAILNKISIGNKIAKYYNLLDFCYDMDYKNFTRSVIYSKIKDFEKFCSTQYTNSYYDKYDKNEIVLRKELMYNIKELKICILSQNDIENIKQKKLEPHDEKNYVFQKYILNDGWDDANFISGYVNRFISESSDCNGFMRFTLNVNNFNLMQLFKAKKSSLIKTLDRVDNIKKLSDNIVSGKYILNDDIDNELNKKENFALVNYYLIEEVYYTYINLLFDYNKCIEMKKQIEKEMEEEKNDLDLL
ncbi:TPA: NACHT domain-containing NTPase [Clostridioides difficile]